MFAIQIKAVNQACLNRNANNRLVIENRRLISFKRLSLIIQENLGIHCRLRPGAEDGINL
jgi:hypothetical protein